jgi:hypothetical protein
MRLAFPGCGRTPMVDPWERARFQRLDVLRSFADLANLKSRQGLAANVVGVNSILWAVFSTEQFNYRFATSSITSTAWLMS